MNATKCCWTLMICLPILLVGLTQPGCGTSDTEEGAPAQPAEQPKQLPEQPGEQPKQPAESTAELPKIPLGLPPLEIPEDNPMTPAKVELGKLLYFDTRLSKDSSISCAKCHDPKMAWAEHTPTSEGIGGQKGPANSPTVINAAYATSQFWDGRAATLEEQAKGPIENPIEMGDNLDDVVKELSAVPEYVERFQGVFGSGVTEDGIAKAIAAFERTVLSGNSPYDRFTKNKEEDALSEAQKRGLDLFDSAGCAFCHKPPVFSTYAFINAGVGMQKEPPDQGRKAVTKKDGDLGKFRIPPLREVAKTAPYFHDGSAKTLEEAVAVMAAGGKDNPNLSSMMRAVAEEKLTEQDQKDLVEFLKALSGDFPVVDPPKLP